MVIVTGTVQVRPESLAEAIALSVEHVHRSRAEPGCISHHVHQDVEDPCRLFFYERWHDRAALDAHFTVPESGRFVTALGGLSAARPAMEIHEVPEG